MQRNLTRLVPVVVWIVLIGIGMVKVGGWIGTPGRSGPVRDHWPLGTTLVQRSGRPTLILFAHPMCPCLKATRTELERVLLEIPTPLDLVIEVFSPAEGGFTWSPETLCGSLKHPRLILDPDGSDALRFGVRISGHVLLYGEEGGLIFSGGITSGRGEVGPNPAMDALRCCLLGKSNAVTVWPVFGCPIHP